MKNFFLTAMGFLIIMTAQSQNKSRYTASGGLLGAVNISEFSHINGPSTVEYKSKSGGAFGAWFNFPLGHTFSFEPQLIYSIQNYKPDETNGTFFTGRLNYFSVPLLFKWHIAKPVALMAGAQFDFLSKVKDDNNNYQKDDFDRSLNFCIPMGVEFFPRSVVSFYGRYELGTTRFYKVGPPSLQSNYRTGNVQIGLKVRLFGHKVVEKSAPTSTTTTPEAPKPQSKQAVQEKKAASQEKDSDGDGIMDKDDKCPAVPGVAKYNGCPVPDTDGDGVNDEQDRCPKTPGIASNRGCPEITVYFKRDEFVLDPEDRTELDQVVRFLTNNPDLSVTLEGHASSLGGSDYNLRLSQHRVDKGKEYIVSKGVSASRIKTNANGEKYPIGDQKTEEGRAKSRRVNVVINF